MKKSKGKKRRKIQREGFKKKKKNRKQKPLFINGERKKGKTF